MKSILYKALSVCMAALLMLASTGMGVYTHICSHNVHAKISYLAKRTCDHQLPANQKNCCHTNKQTKPISNVMACCHIKVEWKQVINPYNSNKSNTQFNYTTSTPLISNHPTSLNLNETTYSVVPKKSGYPPPGRINHQALLQVWLT